MEKKRFTIVVRQPVVVNVSVPVESVATDGLEYDTEQGVILPVLDSQIGDECLKTNKNNSHE